MTPEEREAFYDDHVAPVLLKLGQACKEQGIPFLAVVGYDGEPEGPAGVTAYLPEECAYYFSVMHLASKCWEDGGFNLDRFCIGLARNAHGKEHNSMVLSLMGVPAIPGKTTS